MKLVQLLEFLPDNKIFETVDFDYKFFINQLREYAYLTAGVKFDLIDRRSEQKYFLLL
ncbi:MAG: hypothetical protein KatS3mg101_0434 [Patescibacteria group bacterium]|nr:MAG: hypothetical protein KatS3mg101_0434 [Patescibacteria group bacterium]